MSRRRSVDFVGWHGYRRAWLVPLAALLLVLVTGFRPETPLSPALPPTITNEQAGEVISRAETFDAEFTDRRPGTPGSIESAQWMHDQFAELELRVKTVP